jgi:cytochrome c peroxidase
MKSALMMVLIAATAQAVAVPVAAPLSAAAEIGKQMFFDKSLSGSGKLACANCHDPAFAHAPPNNLAVQLGGPKMRTAGVRAVPSLRYQEYTPPYADMLDNPDGISTPGPGGGYTQDGRAATLADQARIPLLAKHEMANKSVADGPQDQGVGLCRPVPQDLWCGSLRQQQAGFPACAGRVAGISAGRQQLPSLQQQI